MRIRQAMIVAGACLMMWTPACKKNGSRQPAGAQESGSDAPAPANTTERAPEKTGAPVATGDNPTARGGRGEPSLEDPHRAAAWIYVDGKEGRFVSDEGGNPLLQWVIEAPVSPTPTIRLEVFEPLLGNDVEASFVLQSEGSDESTNVLYALAGKPGAFAAGEDYPLNNPGDAFTVRNVAADGAEVSGIDPLPPGSYMIVAAVKKPGGTEEVLAATYFTVK